MNHSGTKALESRRCYMRKLEISDSKQLFENVYSDKKVSGYMSWDTYSDEAQVLIICASGRNIMTKTSAIGACF